MPVQARCERPAQERTFKPRSASRRRPNPGSAKLRRPIPPPLAASTDQQITQQPILREGRSPSLRNRSKFGQPDPNAPQPAPRRPPVPLTRSATGARPGLFGQVAEQRRKSRQTGPANREAAQPTAQLTQLIACCPPPGFKGISKGHPAATPPQIAPGSQQDQHRTTAPRRRTPRTDPSLITG